MERKYSNTIKRNLICAFINNSCGFFFRINAPLVTKYHYLFELINLVNFLPKIVQEGKFSFLSFPLPPNFPKTRKDKLLCN